MANATIPYIIAEDGFYYVAYKEKAKVPEIVVSAKGVANGLSEEYNDGWDFGPDSYSPTSTSAIPYTETVGILEAVKYSYGSESSPQIPIKILAGHFVISPNAKLYQVNTSAPVTGAPEYAIIPVPTIALSGSNEVQNIVIHGSGGLIASGGGWFLPLRFQQHDRYRCITGNCTIGKYSYDVCMGQKREYVRGECNRHT